MKPETTPKTAEEFFREKIKALNPGKEITLSNELITGEQGLRWAHEYKEYCLSLHTSPPA